MCQACLPAQADGTVQGSVALEPFRPASLPPGYRPRTRKPIEQPDPPLAVVYLENEGGNYPKLPAERGASVAQHGYQFRPGVSAVRRGTRVTFPNRDDEFHSVFSFSPSKRFDLGRYRKDETSPPVTFDQPGLVKVYCDIHKHMRALVLVLDTPWFTQTDASGAFKLADVPAGVYRLKAFLASERVLETRVQVEDGKVTHATLPP
jgi:plastocyanin